MYNIKFKNILKNNLYIYISLVILYPKIHPNQIKHYFNN